MFSSYHRKMYMYNMLRLILTGLQIIDYNTTKTTMPFQQFVTRDLLQSTTVTGHRFIASVGKNVSGLFVVEISKKNSNLQESVLIRLSQLASKDSNLKFPDL